MRRLGISPLFLAAWICAKEECSREGRGANKFSLDDVSWEPEGYLRNVTTASRASPDALLDLLRESVHAFTKVNETKELLRIMMSDRYDHRRLMLLDNRVIVAEALLAKSKILPLAISIAQAASKHKLPNAVWLHNPYSAGYAFSIENVTMLPTTVISRHHSEKMGVLVPNPYFANGDLMRGWRSEQKKYRKAKERHPWNERDKRVFWRGAVRSTRTCRHGAGNFARLQAISLSFCRQDNFDVRCVASATGIHGCDENTNVTFDDCDNYPADTDLPFTFKKENLALTTTTAQVLPVEYVENQFLLNLPGSTHGAYSRNLNHLWAMGAVILLWDSPYIEWYYAALGHGLTHLAVNKSTAVRVVESVRKDSKLVELLIKRAADVNEYLLCGDCQLEYLVQVVTTMHQFFNWSTVLDEEFVYVNPPEAKCTPSEPRFFELYFEKNTSKVRHRAIPCNFSATILHNTLR